MADQAVIAVATSDVAIARQNLTLATLTSPIAGTVAQVTVAAGSSVTASSTTAVVTVIGADGYIVSLTVPVTSVNILATGQQATIVAASTPTQLTGVVSEIGILNVSATSTPSYTVTVAVSATDEPLFNGSSAQVAITAEASTDTLTVPSSAVHRTGSQYTVQVLKDGISQAVTVEVGAIGPERTEIVSGLTTGDSVILADLSQPMSTGEETADSGGLTGLGGSNSDTTTGTSNFPGGSSGGFSGGAPPGS